MDAASLDLLLGKCAADANVRRLRRRVRGDDVEPSPCAGGQFDGRAKFLRLRTEADGDDRQLRALKHGRELLQVRMRAELVCASHDDDVALLADDVGRRFPRENLNVGRQMLPKGLHEGKVARVGSRLSE